MERTVQAWKPAEALNESSMSPRDEEYERDLAAWRGETGRSGSRKRSDRRFAAYWAENHQRRFAIESGEIEGLYRLRTQAKEFLVRSGLEHATEEDQVRPVHTTRALRTLLLDEMRALRRMIEHARGGHALTIEEIQAWQREATRHQGERLIEIESDEGTVTRVRIPMVPGQFKQHESLIVSGQTEYEFCPPRLVQRELGRVLDLDDAHRAGPAPTALCAAWMHAAFNAVHPFPDGNGRTGRLLMAWVYLRRDEHPPLIATEDRVEYFQAMRKAHRSDLEALCTLIHESAAVMTRLSLFDAREQDGPRKRGAALDRDGD